MLIPLACIAPLAFTATLHAQQPAPSTVLAKLGEQAASLDRTLPSFGCLQSAISEEIEPGHHDHPDKVLRRVTFTANLRVRRVPGGKLVESAEFVTVDGRPYSAGGFTMPAYAQGGFLQALSYFLPSQQSCYVYSVSPNRVDFTGAPYAAKDPHCRSAGTSGFALLDAGGNIQHIERRVAAFGVYSYHLMPFASVDLVPVVLNGTSYQLSSHLTTERVNGHSIDRFESTYANCKLFTATVTIGPATEPPQ